MMATNTDRVILCLGIETTATAYFTYCFASLRATTEHPDRYFGPFDRNRNGFALGEGAACVAVCSESTARNLGLPVVAVLDKVSNFTLCPDSPTQPSDINKIYSWLDQVIGSSLRDPGLAYWDAHATATPLGDAAEYEIFSRFNVDVPISSYKGLVGHCVAASALVEIVNAIRHLQQGRIPCTQNLLERFVSDDRIITATETTRKKTFVKCSFGFGGRNGVAAISVQ
jgi:3-oxoacyl-[acyl-carrier-protein] synthase II